ncbi:MAG TPA: PilZ domain-containing protein [Phycisphaerae bacterium]|nr:PilZ domain-containing protein [Phycisphaerae bacterium]HRR85474.1 PilZ domain-containing protein [Phycisphaerae bacterium]
MVTIATGEELLAELRRHFRLVEIGNDWPGSCNRRRHTRYELESGSVPVEVCSRFGLTARGLLADIVVGGARVITDYVPAIGEILSLSFNVNNNFYVLDAEVRHVGVEGSIRYVGVRFVE